MKGRRIVRVAGRSNLGLTRYIDWEEVKISSVTDVMSVMTDLEDMV